MSSLFADTKEYEEARQEEEDYRQYYEAEVQSGTPRAEIMTWEEWKEAQEAETEEENASVDEVELHFYGENGKGYLRYQDPSGKDSTVELRGREHADKLVEKARQNALENRWSMEIFDGHVSDGDALNAWGMPTQEARTNCILSADAWTTYTRIASAVSGKRHNPSW